MFAKLLVGLFVISIVFAIAMYPWVTDDDISNLPKEPFARFTSLVYFSVTTFTSTGYGDIAPKSTRAKMVMSMYMAVAFAGALVVATQGRKS
jgi:CBS domain containing-hemolysin-like protein